MVRAATSNVRHISSRQGTRRKVAVLPFMPEHVWIDASVANHPQTIRIMNKLKDVEVDVVDDAKALKKPAAIEDAKRQMILTKHLGQAYKHCQGISHGTTCCNYRVIDAVSGCPMDCSYCILQSYLANNPVTQVHVNLEDILVEVSAYLDSHRDKFVRVGTGELADSLALDPIIDFASILIPFFASKRNAILELKTKTDFVDHLFDLRHGGHTVLAWSMNTPEIIATEERSTASLDARLAAAARAAEAGYPVAFHFDPIILSGPTDETIERYAAVMRRIFENVQPRSIAWVSMGLFRYPSELMEIASRRFSGTKIFCGELVPAGGKMRYLRFIREKVYRALWDVLAEKLPPHKIYLCMETPQVWQKIDPAVSDSKCLEKRLCNMEALPMQF